MGYQDKRIYNSRWDAGTWGILVVVAAVCLWPICLGEIWLPLFLCVGMLALTVMLLKSTFYIIDGDTLIVHAMSTHTAYPISKIKRVRPTRSIISAPAAAMFHRIEVTFTDRKVMKSAFPLVISPVRCEEFVAELKRINPSIIVSGF